MIKLPENLEESYVSWDLREYSEWLQRRCEELEMTEEEYLAQLWKDIFK